MNILSIDGGGIFTITAAVTLDRLEAIAPGFISKVDLFAGTSGGGLAALLFANGGTTKNLISLCENAGELFSRTVAREISASLGLKAKYDNTGRTAVLTQWLGTKTLSDLEKPVAIQSFRIDGIPEWTNFVFHNLLTTSASLLPHSRAVTAVDVGLATSAAPTFFPAKTINGATFVDGGVVGDNPSMMAASLALDSSFKWSIPATLADIKILSIGRVYPGDQIDRSNFDAGYLGWLSPLINLLLTGNQTAVDYQCTQLLGSRFFRHAPEVPKSLNVAIDDASAIPGLQAWASQLDLTAEEAWLKGNWS